MNDAATEPNRTAEVARAPPAEGLEAPWANVVLSGDVIAAIVKGWIDENR